MSLPVRPIETLTVLHACPSGVDSTVIKCSLVTVSESGQITCRGEADKKDNRPLVAGFAAGTWYSFTITREEPPCQPPTTSTANA